MCNQQCCGSCAYNRPDKGDWSCSNEESEMYGMYTEYEDGCDGYQQKGGER